MKVKSNKINPLPKYLIYLVNIERRYRTIDGSPKCDNKLVIIRINVHGIN